MEDFSELIRAIADLLDSILWPLLVLFIVLLLRGEIPGLAVRLRRLIFRVGQQSVEFELDELEKRAGVLEAGAATAARELESAYGAPPPVEGPTSHVTMPHGVGPIDSHFDVFAAISEGTEPRLILIGLAAEIERESRELLASFADDSHWRSRSLRQMLDRLDLPDHIRTAADEFSSVRNRIVHGRDADPADVLRAIDVGISILRTIRLIPRTIRAVYAPSVDLYRDQEGRTRHDAQGVMLEVRNPDGRIERAVYPTTRQYQKGDVVTWEWNTDRVWDEAWFRDPDSGAIVYAWSSAAEFVGKPIDEL